jgi:hypothetical protein
MKIGRDFGVKSLILKRNFVYRVLDPVFASRNTLRGIPYPPAPARCPATSLCCSGTEADVKQLVIVTLLVSALVGALALPASSQTSDGVEAVVTPFGVAISIDDTPVDFGTLSLSSADDSRTTMDSAPITVTNDGSAPADLMIEGSPATPEDINDATWTLDCSDDNGTVAANQFALLFLFGTDPNNWPSSGDSLCPSPAAKPLAAGVGGGGSAEFLLQMNMPTSTSGFSTRTSTVTVTATQSGP